MSAADASPAAWPLSSGQMLRQMGAQLGRTQRGQLLVYFGDDVPAHLFAERGVQRAEEMRLRDQHQLVVGAFDATVFEHLAEAMREAVGGLLLERVCGSIE